jgi:hypothetical protein
VLKTLLSIDHFPTFAECMEQRSHELGLRAAGEGRGGGTIPVDLFLFWRGTRGRTILRLGGDGPKAGMISHRPLSASWVLKAGAGSERRSSASGGSGVGETKGGGDEDDEAQGGFDADGGEGEEMNPPASKQALHPYPRQKGC